MKDSSQNVQILGPYIQFPTSCGSGGSLRNESTLIYKTGVKGVFDSALKEQNWKIAER